MFYSLIRLIDFAVQIYIFIIIARVLLSWIQHNQYHPVIRFIYQVTDPPLDWLRQRLPNFGGLDISPMVLIIAILFLKKIIISILF